MVFIVILISDRIKAFIYDLRDVSLRYLVFVPDDPTSDEENHDILWKMYWFMLKNYSQAIIVRTEKVPGLLTGQQADRSVAGLFVDNLNPFEVCTLDGFAFENAKSYNNKQFRSRTVVKRLGIFTR